MRRIVLLLLACAVITVSAACADPQSPGAPPPVAGNPQRTEPSDEPAKIYFADRLSARGIAKVLYFDGSQPPDTPADTYTAAVEIDRILEMFRMLVLVRAHEADELEEIAPGDFCGYEVHLADGTVHTVWRSGKDIYVDGIRYAYAGSIGRQLHVDEVIMMADCSIGYPPGGQLALFADAFDKRNTLIDGDPVLKQLVGSRWTVVDSVKPVSGVKIPVCDMPPSIDLKDYPQVTTGDFKMIYQVSLPSGKQTEIVVQFTIFEE